MTRRCLILMGLVFLAFVTGIYVGQRRMQVVHASADIAIPQSFGPCRGSMGPELLIFEDAAGTIRLVHPASGQLFGTVVRK